MSESEKDNGMLASQEKVLLEELRKNERELESIPLVRNKIYATLAGVGIAGATAALYLEESRPIIFIAYFVIFIRGMTSQAMLSFGKRIRLERRGELQKVLGIDPPPQDEDDERNDPFS